MALSARITAGTPALFTAVFYDSTTNDPGDPALIDFSWQPGDTGPITTYHYGTDPEIVRTIVNNLPTYSVIIQTVDMVPPGENLVLTGQWDTEGGITISESIQCLVIAPRIPSPFG